MAQGRLDKINKSLSSHVPDNGLMHYGAGLKGSLCGVEDPNRKERADNRGITCPDCRKILKQRP